MKNKARYLIPFAALLLASPAMAQTKYRFEFYGSANYPLKKNFTIGYPQSTVPMKGTYEFSVGARGGARFGSDMWRHWGQDFQYSYGSNAARIINHTNGGKFSFTPRSHEFVYNWLWYPSRLDPKKKVFPYLSAGVGTRFYMLDQKTLNEALDPSRAGLGKLNNETMFTYNFGGGIRFRVNNVYGFRLDVRDNMSQAPRFGLPESSSNPATVVFPVTGIWHQIEVSFSFVYYFR
jgi:hypothetical protein